jgi:four helix bundle protein
MRLVAYDVALEMIRAIAPLVLIIKKHDRDLADQLRRAANSVLLCTGEARRRAGGDRTQLFRTAAGSCDECNSALDGALGWGIALDDKTARALIDRELGLLYGLVHGPKHLRHPRG